VSRLTDPPPLLHVRLPASPPAPTVPFASRHRSIATRPGPVPRAFCAYACGSAIFQDFIMHSAIFAIMTQSFFDFVSHFWVLIHSLSVTQLFFRFYQPFLRFRHTLSHFCYNGSVIFWIASDIFWDVVHTILVTQPFSDFVMLWWCESVIFFIYQSSFDGPTMTQSFFRFCQPFWDFVAHSAIFAIMAQSFFDFIGYFLVFITAVLSPFMFWINHFDIALSNFANMLSHFATVLIHFITVLSYFVMVLSYFYFSSVILWLSSVILL
jgi:hypothetical protein